MLKKASGITHRLIKLSRQIIPLYVVLMVCCTSGAQGQTLVRVSATADTSGLPGALVFVIQNNTVARVRTTDATGTATLAIAPPYVLKTYLVGYKIHTDTINKFVRHLKVQLQDSINALNDVVVTAQYTPDVADQSTYKIKVVDAQKIAKMAAVSLKDALSNELNFRFAQDNALGQSSMSLQGLSGENIKVLIDGVAMIGRQNGSLDLSQINMNDVDHIEIVEGPLSVNYGTNALAGAINIITKKAKKEKISGAVQAYYESNHTYNANATVAISKKAHSLKLTGGRNYFNGWTKDEPFYFLPEKTMADTNRFKSWKPREQYFASAQYGFEKNKLKLAYRSSYFNETIISRGRPVKPYFESAFDDYFKTLRFDNAASLNYKFENYKSFNTVIAYNYYRRDKNTYYKDLTDLSQELAADKSLQDTSIFTTAMARGSFISSKPYSTFNDSVEVYHHFNYELGYDLNYESAFGRRIKDKTQYIGDYALFGSAEIRPVKDLVIRPGLRYAYNTVYQAPLVPSLNIKYSIKDWTIRASYARGFRSPTLKELYFDFVDINHNIIGNTNLRSESSNNYILSYKYKRYKEHYHVSLDQSFFYNDITNLITLGMINSTQYGYVNVGKYSTYGTSANVSYTYKDLTLSVGGAYTARYNNLSEMQSGIDKYSYSPEARASAEYSIEKTHTSFNLFYKYTGKMPGFGLDAANNVYQTFMNDYHTLDATVCQFFFNKKFLVSAGAKNIFDVTNVLSNYSGGVHSASSTSSPISMGRTYFIKLDYVFSSK